MSFSFRTAEGRFHAALPAIRDKRGGLPEFGMLVRLALPISGAALVNMGISITDTLMMGWIGPESLASGALISDVQALVYYLATGVVGGAVPLVARSLGSGRPDEAGDAIRHSFVAAALMAPIVFLAIWHTPDLVLLLGAEPSFAELGRPYAHCFSAGGTTMIFVFALKQMYDATGRPSVYLLATLAALPVNAIANVAFMFGAGPIPAFGLAGAGISSSLVAVLLFAGLAAYARTSAPRGAFGLRKGVSAALLSEVFRLGLPIGFFAIGEVGVFLLSTIVVSIFGVEALAAHAVALRLAGVVYAIPVGITQATTIVVGRALGSRTAGAVQRAVRSARWLGAAAGAAVFGALVCLALIASAAEVFAASIDPRTLAVLIVLLGCLNLAQGFVAPVTGILRSFKDTRGPMVLGLTGYWLVAVPVGFYAALPLGLEERGIWFGLCSGVMATAILVNIRLGLRGDARQGAPRGPFLATIPATRSGDLSREISK